MVASDVETRVPRLGWLAGRLATLGLATALVLAPLEAWFGGRIFERDGGVFRRVLDPAHPITDVMLGPSHSRHGIDPRRLPGAEFENLGLDGVGPSYMRRWYAFYRRHQGPPRRVLLVAPWFLLHAGSSWRRLEHDSRLLPWAEVRDMALTSGTALDLLIFNRFALTKFQTYLAHGVPAGMSRPPSWASRGYAPYRGRRPGAWAVERTYEGPEDPAEVAAFDALLGTLRAEGARVAVVQAPMYTPVVGPREADEARIRAIAAAHDVPFLNYREGAGRALCADEANFWDWHHLNLAGSQLFSRLLGQDLERLGFLDGSRSGTNHADGGAGGHQVPGPGCRS